MAQERTQRSGGGSRNARDVMTPDPATVSAKDSIREAARIMASEDTGVVPVVDGRRIVGLVTDRDIVVRCVAEGKDTAIAKVNECMTKSVRSVKEDTPVAEVLSMMSSAQIRRVPVVAARKANAVVNPRPPAGTVDTHADTPTELLDHPFGLGVLNTRGHFD